MSSSYNNQIVLSCFKLLDSKSCIFFLVQILRPLLFSFCFLLLMHSKNGYYELPLFRSFYLLRRCSSYARVILQRENFQTFQLSFEWLFIRFLKTEKGFSSFRHRPFFFFFKSFFNKTKFCCCCFYSLFGQNTFVQAFWR